MNFDPLKIIILKDVTICNNRNSQCCYNICNLTPFSWISWSICNSSASYRAWLQKPIKIEWKQSIHAKLTEVYLELKGLIKSSLFFHFLLFSAEAMQLNSFSFFHYCRGKKWKKQQSILFTIVLNFSLWACLVVHIHYSASLLAISHS